VASAAGGNGRRAAGGREGGRAGGGRRAAGGRILVAVGACALILVAAGAAGLLHGPTPSTAPSARPAQFSAGGTVAGGQAAGGAAADAAGGPVRVQIVFRTYFEACGHTEERHVASWMAAADARELRRLYPGWHAVSGGGEAGEAGGTGGALVLERREDGYCTDDTYYRHLGIRDGRVAVFWGKPGPGARLKEVTAIKVSDLLAEDRQRLEKGIALLGDDAVSRSLEGLAE